MTDITPKPSQTDEELRRAIEDYQWRWTDFKPGEDAEMDAEIKRVVDEQMALIQADRERLYGELVAATFEYGVSDVEMIERNGSFLNAVPIETVNKVFNREGAES